MDSGTVTVSSFQRHQSAPDTVPVLAWLDSHDPMRQGRHKAAPTATPAQGSEAGAALHWALCRMTTQGQQQHLWDSPMCHPQCTVLGKQCPRRAQKQAFWEGTGLEGDLGLPGADAGPRICRGSAEALPSQHCSARRGDWGCHTQEPEHDGLNRLPIRS